MKQYTSQNGRIIDLSVPKIINSSVKEGFHEDIAKVELWQGQIDAFSDWNKYLKLEGCNHKVWSKYLLLGTDWKITGLCCSSMECLVLTDIVQLTFAHYTSHVAMDEQNYEWFQIHHQ